MEAAERLSPLRLFGRDTMTGRERIERTLSGLKTDRVPWTTIADDRSRQGMSDEYAECSFLDFYRKIGCDILMFGKYGMPPEAQPLEPFEYLLPSSETNREEDGVWVSERSLGKRTLTARQKAGHPIKYPVETAEDTRLLLDIWEGTEVRVAQNYAESSARADRWIGDDGVFAQTLLPSPIQMLIENECGSENFYYLLQDEPELMERLIGAMYAKRRIEYQITAEKSPFPLAIPVENTSTTLISPNIYRKYSMPHIAEYASIMHKNGKKAIIHMCGLLKNLLPSLKETGIDGIHALTEPTVGDCRFEEALDALGDDLIIIGVLSPAVFQGGYTTEEQIRLCVKKTLTDRIRNSHFILWPAIDGLPTPVWKLKAVRDAVEAYGIRS